MKIDVILGGTVEDLKHHVQADDVLIEGGDLHNWHAVHAAAYHGRLDLLEALLAHMGEFEFFNTRGDDGIIRLTYRTLEFDFTQWSVIHVSMLTDEDVFLWLKDHGAKKYVFSIDSQGFTPLHYLMMIYTAIEHVEENDIKWVQTLCNLLFECGGKDLLNFKQIHGQTALSYLSNRITDRKDIYKVLVDIFNQGAEIDVYDLGRVLRAWRNWPIRLGPSHDFAQECVFALLSAPNLCTILSDDEMQDDLHNLQALLSNYCYASFFDRPPHTNIIKAAPSLLAAGVMFPLNTSIPVTLASLYAHPKLNHFLSKHGFYDCIFHWVTRTDVTEENILLLYARGFLMEARENKVGTDQQHQAIEKYILLLDDPVIREDKTLKESTLSSLKAAITAVQNTKAFFIIPVSFTPFIRYPFDDLDELDRVSELIPKASINNAAPTM